MISSVKIEQLSFANAKKDLDRLQALFEFGRIRKNDLVERQADIAQQEVNLLNTQSSLEQAISELTKTIDKPINRFKVLVKGKDKAGEFYRRSFAAMFAYVSNRVPEISDEFYKIDDAMKAGFGWENGPFEIWERNFFSKD